MLDLKAALDLFDSGKWLSVAFVTYDDKRGTAGEIIRIKRCRKLTRTTKSSRSTGKGKGFLPSESPRDPNHDEHFTRNVLLPNGGIRRFHFRLLFVINGEKLL
jgi:hypothetical protein